MVTIDPKTKEFMIGHVRSHVDYPATKDDLVNACNNMSEFAEEQKKWFSDTLPEGTYDNPTEVIDALGW